MTNSEKIRSMPDYELARRLALYYSRYDICPLGYTCPIHVGCRSEECIERFEEWLKQEAKDGDVHE